MWIMTPFGFFSIVCARDDAGKPHPNLRMIRARKITHIKELRTRYPALPQIKITTNTDYPYRIIAPAAMVTGIVTALMDSIDYDNFKSKAHDVSPDDHAYHAFLMSVWGSGLRMTSGGQGAGDQRDHGGHYANHDLHTDDLPFDRPDMGGIPLADLHDTAIGAANAKSWEAAMPKKKRKKK